MENKIYTFEEYPEIKEWLEGFIKALETNEETKGE